MWKFNIISDADKGLKACVDQFNVAVNPHVFAHPELLSAWLKTYRPLRQLQPVYVIGKAIDGNTVTFPLVRWHRNWKNAFQNILVPIGYCDFDYHDPLFTMPLADKQLFWSELLAFLKKEINFDNILIEGITDNIALDSAQWEKGEMCPQLNLDGIDSEDDLMKFFKTSLRGDIRRQMRRLSEIGELTLAEYSSYDSIPTKTFEAFMRNHRLRWPKAYKAPHFHENLLRDGLKVGCVHFSVLKAGDKEVAWHLGYEHNGVYYYYMPCGHQDYLKHSPTKVHLFYLVSRAIEKGYAVFDHLRGDENYKDGWSNGLQYVNTLIANNETAISTFKHNMLKIRHLITLPDKTLTSSYLRCTNTYKYAA